MYFWRMEVVLRQAMRPERGVNGSVLTSARRTAGASVAAPIATLPPEQSPQ